MDTVFLNTSRGNRLGSYMGLQMTEGAAYRHARDYRYIEVPLSEIYNPSSEEVLTKVSANQTVQIIPAAKVKPANGYTVLVKVNPKLQQYANCPAMFMIDAHSDEQPSFYASFRKSMDASELEDWCVRLYLIG